MVVQWRGRGRGAGAVALGLVAGLTAGCSGPGTVAADERSAARHLALVQRTADVLVRSGSSRARTSLETANGGTRVTIRGSGGFDYGARLGRLRVVLPADAAGEAGHRPVTEVLAPGELYLKNRGAGVPSDKWVRIHTAALADGNLVTGGATDPLAAAELLRGARRVTYVGEARAEGDGALVRHYRGTADIRRAAEKAAHVRGALLAAARGFRARSVPFDVFLDERGRLRKVRHRFTLSQVPGGGGELQVVSTTVLYGFGARVDVELPPERDIYSGAVAVTGA
ncbi:hypothetical protein KBZ10_27835 [Streptomyces sp. F63]|uniref:hypothetical protein n=1 Tax=Streptomyces sp. F63 TaxID=2824887 RepID=UPI001B38A883|nr:hypothetical protein [Streptomyces sp. F63]MBQ0988253.1 hypothetical protein [Streptomyces sp. F63]